MVKDTEKINNQRGFLSIFEENYKKDETFTNFLDNEVKESVKNLLADAYEKSQTF